MDTSYWDPSSLRWTAYDLDFYYRRFINDSTRVFSSAEDHIEILTPPRRGLAPPCEKQDGEPVLANCKSYEDDAGPHIYIIRQNNSWSKTCVKQETFEKIISRHDVFPPFLDALHSFGLKTDVDEKVWDGFHASVSRRSCDRSDKTADSLGQGKLNLCYNLRYVEKHGRPSSSLWSLRQVGVYHSFDPTSNQETIILLQPPDSIYKYLKQSYTSSNIQDCGHHHQHPMDFHVAVLLRTLNNWDEYIEDLRGDLIQLDDKVCFSKAGTVEKPNDYPVAFADKQKLQLLRHKLFRTDSVLTASMELAKGLQVQVSKLEGSGLHQSGAAAMEEIKAYCSHLQRHTRNLSVLIQISVGTGDLLSKIIEFRNDRLQIRTSVAAQESLDTLNRLASESAIALEQGRQDSKMLKALTIAATTYLPATLLATIFSSNLVQLRSDSDGANDRTHFHVVSQFWLYVVLSIFLTAATLIPTLMWRKSLSKWLSHQ
ncbi:hypothetical protein EDB81DRAFT_801965 [Dactylonectria macrodidyma]|uniref:CorA-like transporter domain-containing protein n=1 Tax=Dactylonectria macrodidyma TaxID=307937 RepID=A0A9P9IUV2_9HYPO|nr:hypothetical protein EDB81DRAFT_801965 [Dactylonectria macrodidyma]